MYTFDSLNASSLINSVLINAFAKPGMNNRRVWGKCVGNLGIISPAKTRIWHQTPFQHHYSGVIMSAMAAQITGVPIVCSTVCSGAAQRKHQSSALLARVRGIRRWPVDFPHKGPVKRQLFPFDDVIYLVIITHIKEIWVSGTYKALRQMCSYRLSLNTF